MNKTNRKRWKPVWAHVVAAFICVAANFIYAQFSHDVSSAAMTWMFLYPLLGGSTFFALLAIVVPRLCDWEYYRIFFNLYNSGIASLTIGAFLEGIFEIAGTASSYTRMVVIAGGTLVFVALILLTLYLSEIGRQGSTPRRKR